MKKKSVTKIKRWNANPAEFVRLLNNSLDCYHRYDDFSRIGKDKIHRAELASEKFVIVFTEKGRVPIFEDIDWVEFVE